MARVEWTEVPGRRDVFPLTSARVTIGRRSDADIVLSHRLTSRHHAQIEREASGWVIVDLNSTHGTWVNGERVARHELRPKDRIRLGGEDGVELVFLAGAEDTATANDDLLTTAGLDFSMRRLTEVLPASSGRHSELEKISCLLDFHYYFGKAFSPEKTFLHILRSALQISGAGRGFVLNRQKSGFTYALGLDGSGRQLTQAEFKASRTVVDRVTETGEPVFMTQGITGDLAGQASIVAMSLRAVACLPLMAMTNDAGAASVMGILYLDSRNHMHALSGLDQKVLVRLADEAGHVLEKLAMVETLAEKQRVEQELAIAEETQRTLLPRSLPEFSPFAIRAFSRATRELGGDFYDFIPAGDELACVLADVSGKGIPAALLSSLALGALNMEYGSSSDPAAVLNGVNRLLCRKTPANRFVTLFLCQLSDSGKGRFVSAGHNITYIFRAAGKSLEELGSNGMPLGMFAFASYETAPVELSPGDVMVVYSDGLTDAENPATEDFGDERLRALIAAKACEGVDALETALLAALDEFTEGASQTDDITFLLIANRG